MPEKAKVFLADDDQVFRATIKELLAFDGHTVVLEAKTLPEAFDCITRLTEQKIRVAVLDGNLNPFDHSGSDGKRMVIEIRKAAPDVKIIGMSGSPFPEVDVDLGKFDVVKLGQTITKL